jgi:hypothetical protein
MRNRQESSRVVAVGGGGATILANDSSDVAMRSAMFLVAGSLETGVIIRLRIIEADLCGVHSS